MNEQAEKIIKEVKKVIIGKDREITLILTAMLADGHILLDDIPGVGKTTLAKAISKAIGLDSNRIQFTPDTVPSDITGFNMYNRKTGNFEYMPGVANCNLLLADEINRTSSKTQAALLEVMEENHITVDGKVYFVPSPFTVIGTENPVGTAGTQMLPESQLDRFMIQISMGYPDKGAQIEILRCHSNGNPEKKVETILTPNTFSSMINETKKVYVDDKILCYITELIEATRDHKGVKLGVSPCGAIALMSMAKATAFINNRDYVIPDYVDDNFKAVCRHRIITDGKASINGVTSDMILDEILNNIKAPII